MTSTAPSFEEVKAAMHAASLRVGMELLPAAKQVGNRLVVGGVHGSPGKSMAIELEGPKALQWFDQATGEGGDAIDLWVAVRGVSKRAAVEEAAEFLGVVSGAIRPDRRLSRSSYPDVEPAEPPRRKRPRSEDEDEPLDWQKCLQDFAVGNHAEGYVAWRGGTVEFAQRMNEEGMLGIFNDCFAWPVHDAAGKVVGCHYATRRPKPAPKYLFYPKGVEKMLLVVGDPKTANHTLIGESQGDIYAALDSLGYHEEPDVYAAIITRGLSSDISSFDIPAIIAIPQNDPEEKRNKKTQRTPAEQWLENIRESRHKSTRILVGKIPAEFKDANDWIKENKPTLQETRKRLIETARSPLMAMTQSLDELAGRAGKDDPTSLIGYERRWLGKGTSFIITGPGGIGKSTLIMSMAAHWAAGASWHGIKPRRALKVLIVQAENDDGDLAEMGAAALEALALELSPAEIKHAKLNLLVQQEAGRTGEKFAVWLEEMITESGCDLVIIDPLLSYVGADLARQEVASHFFRELMQPILHRTGVIMGFVHHTGKTSSDAKARSNWSITDYQYIGMGSSELSNWPRATACLLPVPGHKGVFRFMLTKRGNRAGMTSKFSASCVDEIHLSHSTVGLGWAEVSKPEPEPAKTGGRKRTITEGDVLMAIGHPSTMIAKDRLVADLMAAYFTSDRTVRNTLNELLRKGLIEIAKTEPRPGGGPPVQYIRCLPS